MGKIMLRKSLVIFFCFMLLILTSACGKDRANQRTFEEPEEDVDIDTFLQTVDLPENFSVGFDTSKVRAAGSAKIYKAVPLEFDADKIAEKLLRGKIISTEIYAQGPWFETEDKAFKEYLTVFDGGKSLGVESGVAGGLSYSVYLNEESFNSIRSELFANQPGPPDSIAQKWGYNLKSDYASFADLSFMSYKDVLEAVEKLLSDTLGFPELEVAETYSLDLETMLKHYELYLKSREHFGGEEEEEILLTKDDECYVFFFRQMIDDIPVINVIWQGGNLTDSAADISKPSIQIAAGNVMPGTSVNVRYDRNGVRNIDAHNLYETVESVEEKPLISAAKALQVVIDDYSEILLASETIVESMELCYVAISSGDSYQLIPAWVFCIAQDKSRKDLTDSAAKPVFSYEFYVIDAMTGKKISS
ncbi:MAG: hypothetical protein GX094_08550 [Clostridiales bacterium]|nr:hypothetical protein [Clostridiales bacterium]